MTFIIFVQIRLCPDLLTWKNQGVWLQRQGLFSYENLAFIWPVIGEYGSDSAPTSNIVRGGSAYSPVAGDFTTNWNFAGEQVDIMDATDNWTT